MITEVVALRKEIRADIKLPASKSISNRVLIIKAIGELNFDVRNLSGASDTIQLEQILGHSSNMVDAGEGGTTLRFLLAYYCLKGDDVTITAAEPLRKRPVATLVEALRSIGAAVDYLEAEGRLPLRVRKSELKGNKVIIPGDISSQFISALMMIGPYIKGGLHIEITGEILSVPYILMTRSVMEYFGAKAVIHENIIHISEGKYTSRDIEIESDWSAASYWYEIAALSAGAEINLAGLTKDSLQGDAVIARMMEHFGVFTTFSESGVLLLKKEKATAPEYFIDDFSGCPDLGPAVAAVCAGLNVTADLPGLKNFRLKESDRAASLQRELYNMNVKTDFCGGSKFKLYRGAGIRKYNRPVRTYHDHRIAMAFAPLSLITGSVLLDDSSVVNKSYPGFFNDLERAGFKVVFHS